jgi:hypothetical protein
MTDLTVLGDVLSKEEVQILKRDILKDAAPTS